MAMVIVKTTLWINIVCSEWYTNLCICKRFPQAITSSRKKRKTCSWWKYWNWEMEGSYNSRNTLAPTPSPLWKKYLVLYIPTYKSLSPTQTHTWEKNTKTYISTFTHKINNVVAAETGKIASGLCWHNSPLKA